MDPTAIILDALNSGLRNLAAYLAAHVLLCLLPAFFIAGAMTALIPKEAITRFLGRSTPRRLSYPAAAGAGALLAVCSCTIVPLFAGIWRKGAGIGPAVTFLFFAPAANIMALVYTGGVIGADIAIARFVLSLVFGIGIGLLMALIFRADDAARDRATDTMFAAQSAGPMPRAALAFLAVWVALLLFGTLKLPLLTQSFVHVHVPFPDAAGLQSLLDHLVPFDASKGEEGVSLQGAVLIALLVAIAPLARAGFERIHDGANHATRAALGLIALTLLFAALDVRAVASGLDVGVTGKFVGVALGFATLWRIARTHLDEDQRIEWLWESWRFVKQIFPLLVAGVFAVGVLREFIEPRWIESLAGANTLTGNLAGVAFGVVMYFPTLVEVPVARLFLDLGMHRGPLLAYLMADPELSLQSILMLSAIIGRTKTWTYVAWVALFSTVAGLLFGVWVDGGNILLIGLLLVAALSVPALLLWRGTHRSPP